MTQDATGSVTTLPDGRSIHCVNAYEVDFGWHEIVSDDLAQHGLNLPAAGTYIDVGANIGLFCLRLRDLCPAAQLFAFEPMPAAFRALQHNAASMGGFVEVGQMALGAAPGRAVFDHFPAISALSTADPAVGKTLADGLRSLLFGQGASAEIRAIIDRTGAHERLDDTTFVNQLFRTEPIAAEVDTLDNVVARYGIGSIDLLKIDTEGQERAVLDGIGPTLWPRIRQLLVEVHRGPEELRTFLTELEGHGYRSVVESHPMAQGGAPVFHIYSHRP
jgi:FkbM family methyltransferase